MSTTHAYRPYWHPLARASEVTETPRRYILLAENLVAFRIEGEASVFKDLCVHRGTALSLGRVIDGTLECAYHGWRYDASGECVRIPALDPDAAIPGKARAVAYPVREEAGLLWVALKTPRAPFPSFASEYAH